MGPSTNDASVPPRLLPGSTWLTFYCRLSNHKRNFVRVFVDEHGKRYLAGKYTVQAGDKPKKLWAQNLIVLYPDVADSCARPLDDEVRRNIIRTVELRRWDVHVFRAFAWFDELEQAVADRQAMRCHPIPRAQQEHPAPVELSRRSQMEQKRALADLLNAEVAVLECRERVDRIAERVDALPADSADLQTRLARLAAREELLAAERALIEAELAEGGKRAAYEALGA